MDSGEVVATLITIILLLIGATIFVPQKYLTDYVIGVTGIYCNLYILGSICV